MSFNKEVSISCFDKDISVHHSDYKVHHLVTSRLSLARGSFDVVANIYEV